VGVTAVKTPKPTPGAALPSAAWILITKLIGLLAANSSGGKYMKMFVAKIRDITISGILALLPLYVFLLVISKAWKSLSSIGAGIAQMFGMKSILGVGGASVFSWLLIVAIWLVTGILVRYSFLGAVSKAAERQLSKYIPDYDSYKAKAEEKLQHKVRILPYTSALIRWEEYWQPGYIVEQVPRPRIFLDTEL
jgi:hypothetical protein